MDWDDLKFFVAMCEHGNLSKASKHLNVEHSTVVRRLDRLEKALNVRLFDRMARGWKMTSAGTELSKLTQPLEENINRISRFSVTAGDISGEVRLTAPPALLAEIVVPALSSFSEEWPQITLSIISETRAANLSAGEADIALRMLELDQGELVTRTLCRISYDLYGLDHWLDVPNEERRYVGFLQGGSSFISQIMDQHIGQRMTVLRSNDLRVVSTAVKAGFGIGLLPKFLAEKDPNLRVVDILARPASHPVSMVMQQDVRHSPRVRAVADFLGKALAKQY